MENGMIALDSKNEKEHGFCDSNETIEICSRCENSRWKGHVYENDRYIVCPDCGGAVVLMRRKTCKHCFGVGVDFVDRARAMNAGGSETLPECPYCS